MLLMLLGQTSPSGLSSVQQQELKIWTEQLSAAETPARIRQQAANLLLSRSYPQATEALLGLLTAEDHQPAKIAIAKAIAAGDGARKEFIEPLMAMLAGPEPEVRAAAGEALLTYRDDGVIERMIAVMRDGERDRAVRLDTMRALDGVLDKRVVGALVELLGAEDAEVAAAALETLPKLTKIYGYSPQQWRFWWRQNQRKPLSEMLKEWAEKIAKRSRELEDENAQLRSRLVEATEKLYDATPAEKRDARLAEYLDDPLAEVRAVGLKLLDASLARREKVGKPLQDKARQLLDDPSALVRSRAAALAVKLAGAEAGAALLARLETESVPEVRQALLKALAHARLPEALPAVLDELASEQSGLAAAAATALEKTVDQNGIDDALRARAVELLLKRYAAADGDTPDVAAAREALLRAMGAVGSKRFLPVLREALTNRSAVVRLAAVHGLGKLGKPAAAEALVPLVKDADRGIRRAAIVALGALDGTTYVRTIIQQTFPEAEADAGVRQQANDEAMRIIERADADALGRLAERMVGRPQLRDWRIRVLTARAEKLTQTDGREVPGVLRELAAALRAAERHAEAAKQLRRAYEQLEAADSDEAKDVWVAWLDALCASDAGSAVGAMLDQPDEEAFARAYGQLRQRLDAYVEDNDWQSVAAVTDACITKLAPRLTVEQLVALKKLRTKARNRLAEADGSTQPAGARTGQLPTAYRGA